MCLLYAAHAHMCHFSQQQTSDAVAPPQCRQSVQRAASAHPRRHAEHQPPLRHHELKLPAHAHPRQPAQSLGLHAPRPPVLIYLDARCVAAANVKQRRQSTLCDGCECTTKTLARLPCHVFWVADQRNITAGHQSGQPKCIGCRRCSRFRTGAYAQRLGPEVGCMAWAASPVSVTLPRPQGPARHGILQLLSV